MKKVSLFLIFLLLLSGVLISCSSDGGGSDSDDNETLVTHYSYNLNLELTNSSTGEKKNFHKVTEYRCVDNDDTTYSVKNYKIHYFAVENENYTNLSGGGAL